jgi:hypothetical protein
MQRHFSNRGEALAEVAAAKMRAGRKPPTISTFANQSGRRIAPGQWQSPAVEVIRPAKPSTKKEPEAKVQSVFRPPEL